MYFVIVIPAKAGIHNRNTALSVFKSLPALWGTLIKVRRKNVIKMGFYTQTFIIEE